VGTLYCYTGTGGMLLVVEGCSCWCIAVLDLAVRDIVVGVLPRGMLVENEQRLVWVDWIAGAEVVLGMLVANSLYQCFVHVLKDLLQGEGVGLEKLADCLFWVL